MNLPTKQDFATEIRSNRLRMLWQFTLTGAVIVFWVVGTLGTVQHVDVGTWMAAAIAVAVGCLLTRVILMRGFYEVGVWIYALGAVVAITLLLMGSDPTAAQLAPFVFPLIVFMIGLMIRPSHTLVMAIVTSLIVIFAPAAGHPGSQFGWNQFVAILLTFLAAALSAQATGEMVQIAEWALFNYQRERKTTEALFDNRQALERSLIRSQALSEELQSANSELDGARVAAEEAKHFRGQFLANMSHELRTPLNAIIGFSETMLRFPAMYDGVTLPAAYEGDLTQIYNSGRSLLSLINDILDLSKVDAGKLELHMQRVEIGPIIDTTIATAAGLLGAKPIRLERNLPEVLPVVWADEGRMRQVIMNLYSNAVKFTESGSITLTVREMKDGVQFSVKDTGVGIEAKYHEIIFEEFKQAGTDIGRDPRSGSGLGLTIARQLLNLMGGRIWVESERGKGSSFNFIVPVYNNQDEGTLQKRPQDLSASLPAEAPVEDREAVKVV